MINRFLKLATITACALGLLNVSAKADVGYAIGIAGSMATYDTSGTEREGNSSNTPSTTENNSTSVSKDVDYGSVFAEIIVKGEGNLGMTFGVDYIPGEAELGAKSRTDTTTDGNETNQDDSTYTAKAEVSGHFSAYIEPTYYVNDNFGLFVKGGYSQVTVDTLENLDSGTDASDFQDATIDGLTWGVGLRRVSDAGVLMKLEYFQTDYDSITLDSTTGNKNRITADVEQKAVKLSIGYQF